MVERKRTRAEARNYVELIHELESLEAWNETRKIKDGQIPDAWREIARDRALPKRKTPVTLRVDEDVAKWFRALGQGYQTRMNQVLRAYMLSILSREIETCADRDWKGAAL